MKDPIFFFGGTAKVSDIRRHGLIEATKSFKRDKGYTIIKKVRK